MDEEIKELLQKNIELSEEILKLTKKSHNILFWQRVFGVLKVLLIVIPIILGFIYLPPLFNKAVNYYKEFLDTTAAVKKLDPRGIDYDKITPEFIKNLKKE